MRQASLRMGGDVHLRVIRPHEDIGPPGIARPSVTECLKYGAPRLGLADEVNRWRLSNLRHLWRGLRDVRAASKCQAPTLLGMLWLKKIGVDGSVLELGLASARVVTTAGANFIVDAFQNIVEPEIMRYHGIGTGTTAEAVGDTALETELTTQYNPDSTRATGTLAEGASANIFRTVGTNTVDASVAITEHGILSQAATGGGTLLDRSVFSAVNLVSGESLQSTYDLTVSAGG